MNRRDSPRVDVRLRCQVDSPGLRTRTAMFTENISRTGMLLAWAADYGAVALPDPGQMVTVEVELPAHHGFGQKCIHCQGTVARVDGGDSAPRVAVDLNYMKFRACRSRVPSVERLATVASGPWMA